MFLGENKSIIGLVGRGCNSMNSQEVFFFRCFEIGCANRYCIHSFHAKHPMFCSIVAFLLPSLFRTEKICMVLDSSFPLAFAKVSSLAAGPKCSKDVFWYLPI